MASQARVCACFALLLLAAPRSYAADGPEIEVPESGVQRFIAIGALSALDYRELLLARSASTTVSAGISQFGFSASVWRAQTGGSGRSASEILVGYSHKFPIIDLHVGMIGCSLDKVAQRCLNGARFSATTNGSRSTVAEFSVDKSSSGNKQILAASVAHTFGNIGEFLIGARAGWSRWDIPGNRASGASLKVLARTELSWGPELHLSAGVVGSRYPDIVGKSSSAGVATANLVWNFP